MNKVLIITMSCGQGHNSIAKALEEEFLIQKCDVKTIQLYGFNNKVVEFKNKQFLNISKYFPKIYDFIWNKLRKRNFNKKSKFIDNEIKSCKNYILEQINSFNPNIIISTHINAAILVHTLKHNNLINNNITTSNILFDYCVHPYWELANNCDYIFTPLNNTTEDLLKRGYNQNQIKPFGFPVNEKFKPFTSVSSLRKNLQIEDKFTVFIISGGAGLGNTFKLVKKILEYNNDVNIICVNGKNKKSFFKINNYIKKNNCKNIINLGFINNVYDYMGASDLIICRGGGGTLTEALNMEKPFIIREKMIINEKLNKQFFMDKNCCLGMNKISDGGLLVKKARENNLLYQNMKNNIKKLAKPFATKNIVSFLLKQKKIYKN